MAQSLKDVQISLLNLVPYPEGKTIAQAFQDAKDLAQHAERWGYHRYWMAEHHNLEGIASSATAVLIGYIAEQTKTIRVGSGGIMLPNHSPLIVAEQFGTLATLYPGRIDLGLGRAPGTDPMTMRAIRGPGGVRGTEFPELIEELVAYFRKAEDGQRLKAIPGEGTEIPIWILGSSLFSAKLAAQLGRPYAFAGHFAPQLMRPALEIYRSEFQPSEHLEKPRVMVGVPAVAAETKDRAAFLATSGYQTYLSLLRGRLRPMPPPVPVERLRELWAPHEEAAMQERMSSLVMGGPEEILKGLQETWEWTRADEFIIASDVFDHQERLRSFEIISEVAKRS